MSLNASTGKDECVWIETKDVRMKSGLLPAGVTASHPDHSVSLVVGLSDASVLLDLSRPSLPQGMQIILDSTVSSLVRFFFLSCV